MSDNYSLLAIQGPKAIESMQCLTKIDLKSIKYYNFKVGEFAEWKILLSLQQDIQEVEGLKFIVKTPKLLKYGIKFQRWKEI